MPGREGDGWFHPLVSRGGDRAAGHATNGALCHGDDPDEVGRQAVEAMLTGEREVTSGGLKNKILTVASRALPDAVIGAAHERFADKD